MVDVMLRIGASVVMATFFCLMTMKMLGAIQQGGYKNATFWRWLRKKENMLFNRLCVFALCMALASAVFALCFSFLDKQYALAISAIEASLCSRFATSSLTRRAR